SAFSSAGVFNGQGVSAIATVPVHQTAASTNVIIRRHIEIPRFWVSQPTDRHHSDIGTANGRASVPARRSKRRSRGQSVSLEHYSGHEGQKKKRTVKDARYGPQESSLREP